MQPALTRLTRLAQREPARIELIVEVLSKHLPGSVAAAIEVALETGDPMPEALERALVRTGSTAAREEVARHVPLIQGPLQEVAIRAVEALLADPAWPQDSEASARRRALEIALGRRLFVAGRSPEARAVLEQAIAALDPGDRDLLTDGYDALATVLTDLGEHSASVDAAREAYRLGSATSDDGKAPVGALVLALALRAAGDLNAARAALTTAVPELADQAVAAEEMFAELTRDQTLSVALEVYEEGLTGFTEVTDGVAEAREGLHEHLLTGAAALAELLEEADPAAARALEHALPALRLIDGDPRRKHTILAALALHAKTCDWSAVARDLRRVAETAADIGDSELASTALGTEVALLRRRGGDPAALIDALGRRAALLVGADVEDVDLHALLKRGGVTSIDLSAMDRSEADALLNAMANYQEEVEEELEELGEAIMLAETHRPQDLPELLKVQAGLERAVGDLEGALETSVRAAALTGAAFLAAPGEDVDAIASTLFELTMVAKGDKRLVPDVGTLEATAVEALRRASLRPRGTLSRLAAATAVLIESSIAEAPDVAERLYEALLAVAADHPDESALQVARGMQGSQLLDAAREAGDLPRALELYRQVAAAARALPGDRVLAVERGICAVDTMGLAARAGDESTLAFVAADALDVLRSPEYLDARARDVGDDPEVFVAYVEEAAAQYRPPASRRKRLAGLRPESVGVAEVPDEALELLGVDNLAYVPRDVDGALDAAIREARDSPSPSLVVVAGPPGAGRTRTLFEAARRDPVLRDAPLLRPRDARELAELLAQEEPDERFVIWLDEAEPLGGLPPGAVVLATAATGGTVDLSRALSPTERARLEDQALPAAVVRDLARDGFGPTLAAAPTLLARMADGDPDGVALVQAAIDWRLCGLRDPVLEARLRALWRHYVTSGADFDAALTWATCAGALHATVAGHDAAGWLVAAARGRAVPAAVWDEILSGSDPEDAALLGDQAVREDRIADALRAYRLAAGSDLPQTAGRAGWLIGALLSDQGAKDAAVAAWEPVIAAGDPEWAPRAANDAGRHLVVRGDRGRARAYFETALRYDQPEIAADAHFSLGNLHLAEGDHERACELYQLVIASNDADKAPKALVNLGEVRRGQGDFAAARSAYERARASGHAYAAPRAAADLGELLEAAGETDAARAAYRQALESADGDFVPRAALALGMLSYRDRDQAGAEAAFARAVASGDPDKAPLAAVQLGILLEDQGRAAAAREALEVGARASDPAVALWARHRLAVVLAKQGEFERAEGLLEEVARSDHADAPLAAKDLETLRKRVGGRRRGSWLRR